MEPVPQEVTVSSLPQISEDVVPESPHVHFGPQISIETSAAFRPFVRRRMSLGEDDVIMRKVSTAQLAQQDRSPHDGIVAVERDRTLGATTPSEADSPLIDSHPTIRRVPRIIQWIDCETIPSPIIERVEKFQTAKMEFVTHGEFVLADTVFADIDEDGDLPIVRGPFYVRAGPFHDIVYDPKTVKACIVTCGGLCPGLNNCIREITMTLYYQYGVPEIYGIHYGYKGFYDGLHEPLTPDRVSRIHHEGGTILHSSRGGMNPEKIMDAILEKGYNQVYIIGGDGTHRGAQIIFDEIQKRRLKISIAGIPKTIDNDIALIDKSFGFDTSVEEAQRAIRSANVEAKCYQNCVSIVKLMGRSAGFIAMYATLASREVNLCLIPEVKFTWDKLFAYIKERLIRKSHCVIVVAEGAGQDLCQLSGDRDASGNIKLADIGKLLKDKISEALKKEGIDFNIKYIDPTYMIRSVAANAGDSVLCSQLAPNAVHGLFAGYTGFTVGSINNRIVYLPFHLITSQTRSVDSHGRMYARMLASTGQPDLV